MADERNPLDSLREMEKHFRECDAWINGPWTTNFQQLIDRGIELPDPDTIDDANVTAKLWEVIEELAKLRVFLDQTDHLSDRELYAVLWRETLRHDFPDVPEPCSTAAWHVNLPGGDAESRLYLKYYADDAARERWRAEFPDYDMPAHEEPQHNRDWCLPAPYGFAPKEARLWLRDNRNPHAFAANRFSTTSGAAQFVDQLYLAGATKVMVDNIVVLRREDHGPYADALIVELPDDPKRSHDLLRFIDDEARPDEREDRTARGKARVWLWWD